MKDDQAWVRDFHHLIGATVGSTPAIRDGELRARLILEECVETVIGLLGTYDAKRVVYDVVDAVLDDADYVPPSLVAVADGCSDLHVVTFGTEVACGIDSEAVFNEVMTSNMTKGDGPIREDGKRLKGPSYRSPGIEGCLRAMGWKT